MQGQSLEVFIEAWPELWEYLRQFLVIREQGFEAARAYGYPTDNKYWQVNQQMLAVLWQDTELRMRFSGLKADHENAALTRALCRAFGMR